MRVIETLLRGKLISNRTNPVASVTDPVDALGACSGNLFGLLMTRLQQMVEDFTACRQEATANDPQHDCSDSIQRAKVDLQQLLVNYSYCTKNIQ